MVHRSVYEVMEIGMMSIRQDVVLLLSLVFGILCFVQECLKEFGNNPDVVISHVLDNTLPPRLQQMDQQAPRYCVQH